MGKILRGTCAIIFVILILAAPVLCGCGESGGGDDSGYAVKVLLKGDKVASLSLSDMESLPQVTVIAKDKDQTGPTLLSVLDHAGVTDFSKVTVAGYTKQRVATAELELSSAEINDQVVLDFTNSGTVKLAGPNIDEDKWIIDVSEIRAE